MISELWTVWKWFCIFATTVGFGTYLLPQLFELLFYRAQNLKQKYHANWALVTGSSSGIGKAIAEQLLEQEVNVVLVALEDDILKKTTAELTERFPKQQVRMVGCNLGDPNTNYMAAIEKATSDIHVKLLFNNAGYILPGFFADTTLAAQLSNFECNAGASVRITHHFLNKMLDAPNKGGGPRGFIGFTSSPGSMYPGACFSLYGSTKAFVTAFGTSLAPELKSQGVDVLVVQPSPVLSNFYAKTSALDALNFFKATATTPARLANCFFRGAGRVSQFDQGYFAMSTRLLFKIIDLNFLVEIMTRTAHQSGDFKRLFKPRKAKTN